MNIFNVPGSPYMTFNYTTALPTFTSLSGKITNINAKTVTPGVISAFLSSPTLRSSLTLFS